MLSSILVVCIREPKLLLHFWTLDQHVVPESEKRPVHCIYTLLLKDHIVLEILLGDLGILKFEYPTLHKTKS